MHFSTYCSNISFYFIFFFFKPAGKDLSVKLLVPLCNAVCMFVSIYFYEAFGNKPFQRFLLLFLSITLRQSKSSQIIYIFPLFLSNTLRRLNSSHSKDFHSIFICYSEAIKIKLNHIYFPLFLSITLS